MSRRTRRTIRTGRATEVGASWLKAAAVGLLVVAIAAAVGYVPTVRASGADGVSAMWVGCGIGLVSNWIGLIATAGSFRGDPARRPLAVLLGTAVRFLAVMVFTASAALSGLVPATPLVVWVAISYLTVLAVDTAWLVRQGRWSEAEEHR